MPSRSELGETLGIYNLDTFISSSWDWTWLGPVLLLSVLLFLSGALVLQMRKQELASGLLTHFEVDGRLALIPASLYLMLWIPLNGGFRISGKRGDA